MVNIMSFRFNWFEITGKANFERFLIQRYKGKEGLKFLEIGPFEGMSTVWMLENVLIGDRCKLMVIDTFLGSAEHKELGVDCSSLVDIFNENTKKWWLCDKEVKLETIRGKSQEELSEKNTANWGEIFDFIYVDGSHFAEDVYIDGINGFRLLKKGGIIAFDDYLWNGVTGKQEDTPKPGIDRFLHMEENKGKYNMLLKDYQVWIEKIYTQ